VSLRCTLSQSWPLFPCPFVFYSKWQLRLRSWEWRAACTVRDIRTCLGPFVLMVDPGVATPWPSIHVCAFTHIPRRIYALWIPALIFELVLFLLAFYKGWRHVLKFKGGNWWCPRLLTGILMRDTTLHFVGQVTGFASFHRRLINNMQVLRALPRERASLGPATSGMDRGVRVLRCCRDLRNGE
jgi:hypothetical protein